MDTDLVMWCYIRLNKDWGELRLQCATSNSHVFKMRPGESPEDIKRKESAHSEYMYFPKKENNLTLSFSFATETHV